MYSTDVCFLSKKGSKVRFMDTMSLHMAISGLTGFQRTLWMASRLGKKKGLQEVKEHIKKAGQKKEGPMVCLFTIFQLQHSLSKCQYFFMLRLLVLCHLQSPV